jgi:hypothetical protein
VGSIFIKKMIDSIYQKKKMIDSNKGKESGGRSLNIGLNNIFILVCR